ncbi:MAG: PepSY-like domain-containing protein [Pseudoflavonifractor sp.]|nr:PepSY-like domain-containing protein [Alloprevotella sp.]MCM1116526.1 PepSY-like domain-containing protein [Pseudoflavonifractor sp.]
MKTKTLLMALVAILVAMTSACSDDDDIKDINQLPSAAKALISSYFPGSEIRHIKRDGSTNEYDVTLADRTELDFDANGILQEVDCSKSTGRVPDGLILPAILDYVTKIYPGMSIVKYELKWGGYEAELSNGLELMFNSKGDILGADN